MESHGGLGCPLSYLFEKTLNKLELHSSKRWRELVLPQLRRKMLSIKYDKVYEFDLTGTASFGDLEEEEVYEIYKDGRVASHLLEPQLVKWFPALNHVKGCKGHDHVHNRDGRLFDAKNFTCSGGCRFMPSKMIGIGRTFDKEAFLEKAKDMTYIICDIVEFPKVRVIFKEGAGLARKYPKGSIPKSERDILFS